MNEKETERIMNREHYSERKMKMEEEEALNY